MPAPYSAKAVANYFLGKRRLTQMQLHKLLYYAHGWHLGFTGKPLLDETLEAWQYGPVVPSIYGEFRSFGASPIRHSATEFDPQTMSWFTPAVDSSDEFVRKFLDHVWKVYKGYTAAQLLGLTHATGSPWTVTREQNPGIKRAGIPNDVIRSHFAERVRQNRNAG